MPVYFGNKSHNIIFGTNPIEKMGGNKLTYSMYGDNIPSIVNDIIDIYTNSDDVFVLKSNGDLWAVGRNQYGTLGLGHEESQYTFVKIAENVKKVEVSPACTTYLTYDNILYGTGFNSGSLGNGKTERVTSFVKMAENVNFFIKNYTHCCYVDLEGKLYGSGLQYHGQLGTGTGNNTPITTFKDLGRSNVVKLFSAYQSDATWYIDNNGNLYGCGDNFAGVHGTGDTTDVGKFTKRASNVKDFIDDNQYHSWYITNDGDLYGCGYNTDCSQGISATTTSTKTFARRAKNVSAVLAGYAYTFYIDNKNKLYACGANVNGLSSSTSNVTKTFTIQAENVKTIVNRSMYIDCNNTLWARGTYNNPIYGLGEREGVLTKYTKIAENVKKVVSTTRATFYQDFTNSWYVCGKNTYGFLNNSDTSVEYLYFKPFRI